MIPAAAPSSARRPDSCRYAVHRTAGSRRKFEASSNIPCRGESRKMLSSLDLLHLARTAAARAAEFIRTVERPGDPTGWQAKQSRDFVTEVDRVAERMIVEVLLAGDPAATVVGEELHPELRTRGL